MADDLSSDDRAFVDELRTWLSEHLVGEFKAAGPVGGLTDISHWDLRRAWERELAAGRWLNIAWPVEYGGRGGTIRQELLFHLEHAAWGAPYWVGVQGRDLFGPTLLEHGTAEQKARFLPRITSVTDIWGQGFSEPDAGSDLAGMKTRGELDGDEWVITGQKIWMTFGGNADWMYVLCRTDPASERHRGISMLLIDAKAPGIEVRPIRTMAGHSEFAEVFFDGARTAADLVVGEPGQAWAIVMATLGNERGGTTTIPYQESFKREMQMLLFLSRERGINTDRVVRDRLMRFWIRLRLMELNNLRLQSAAMNGKLPGPESSIGKLVWANWHRDFGELMMDLRGVDAIASTGDLGDDPMVHSFLNSRAETIYGGANEIQRNILGERVLGLPK
ncbi:MAG: acyl-CoA dehydrogenase family protein [Acidimicrobiia bacterium]